MRILSLDTSMKTAYVALTEVKNGIIIPISLYSYLADSHTVALNNMLDSILKLSGTKFDDIDFYASSTGPGSFTGIRIGVSVIKGLSFVDSKPCVGVSSLESMAYSVAEANSGVSGIITPLIDARRSSYYTAVFHSDGEGNIKRLTDDAQIEINDYFDVIGAKLGNNKLILTGDGADSIKKEAKSRGIAADVVQQNIAYGVAIAALKNWNQTADKSIFTPTILQPVYLKKSQAERERDERLALEN